MNADGSEEKKEGYAWEGSFERSWDAIQEDEDGTLNIGRIAETQQRRRKRQEVARSVRKGMIRYVYVIIDLSKIMGDSEWKPTRITAVAEILETFIREYFDQNPISHLGFIATKDGKAERLSDMSGNPKLQLEALKSNLEVSGEPSLQNALELAKASLKTIPSYGSREVIVMYGSLATTDPGDIFATIASLSHEKIKVSILGMTAEMFLLRKLAEDTNGTYHIAVDKEHMRELIKSFTIPSPVLASQNLLFASFVQMGFPERRKGVVSPCICHKVFKSGGYFCPRCRSKSCELPTTCEVCNLPLISSPHLARSYHHLFPVAAFIEKKVSVDETPPQCQACLDWISSESFFTCSSCEWIFCSNCDTYIHDSLHNCPGCTSS